jgi:peroxiredoxin Q/BCP
MLLSLLGVMMFGSALEVGGLAPDFSMPDTDGQSISLSHLVKKGPVVLVFFPKAFTPG